MIPNPFITDRPLLPDELAGRDCEVRELLQRAEGGHNSLLLGPRRYGKTSVLKKVARQAELAGMATVSVDFYGIVSLEEMVMRLEAGYRAGLQGALARWYAGVVRTWGPGLTAAPPGTGVTVQAGPQAETSSTRLLHELLGLPVALHRRSGRRALIVFDEFQSLLGADDRVDGLIRSHIQNHRDEASYVFAGSEPGLMAEIFEERERPLYGQARPLRLAALDDDVLAALISERFAATSRDPGAGLGPLLDLVRGHPQRAMLVAYHLWEQTPPGGEADAEAWATASAAVLRELQESFERTWEGLSTSERRTLAAVAWSGPWGGGDSLFSTTSLARFKLTKSAIQYARRALLRRGELERVEGSAVRIVDPLLEAWIASGRRVL